MVISCHIISDHSIALMEREFQSALDVSLSPPHFVCGFIKLKTTFNLSHLNPGLSDIEGERSCDGYPNTTKDGKEYIFSHGAQ